MYILHSFHVFGIKKSLNVKKTNKNGVNLKLGKQTD